MIIKKYFKSAMSLIRFILTPKKTGLYQYKNYEEYKQTQIEGNIKKINSSWVCKDDIEFLSDYLKKEVPDIKFGICHGTRRGEEQEWFSKKLGIEVIGTEISPTAKDFPNTIQWDFHDVKDEWINNVDFIYSNAFDHSFKPAECLDAWMSCIKENGICILEWTMEHIIHNKLDPFGGTLKDYKKLINKKYNIKKILGSPNNKFCMPGNRYFLMVTHKNK